MSDTVTQEEVSQLAKMLEDESNPITRAVKKAVTPMEINTIFSISQIKRNPIPTVFGLGFENELLIRGKTDMKKFKTLTTGHWLIMGRKTFESLGSKSLPNRKTVVVSSMGVNDFPKEKNCHLARTLKDAIDICREEGAEKTFVIGGADLIREVLPQTNTIYYTSFHYEMPLEKVDTFIDLSFLFSTKKFTTKKFHKDRERVYIVPLDKYASVSYTIIEFCKISV